MFCRFFYNTRSSHITKTTHKKALLFLFIDNSRSKSRFEFDIDKHQFLFMLTFTIICFFVLVYFFFPMKKKLFGVLDTVLIRN